MKDNNNIETNDLCYNCKVFCKTYFNKLDKDDIFELSKIKTCRQYKKGQIIYAINSQPTGIFCIKKGKIKIYNVGYEANEQIIRIALAGDIIGVRDLLGNLNYTSFAETIEDSIICFINKQYYMEVLQRYPHITMSIFETLCKIIVERNKIIHSLSQKTVRERLAETLIVLNKVFYDNDNKESFPVIALSRKDLANFVGTATETVIRLLSEFKEEKIISVEKRKITILNPDKLINIANIRNAELLSI